MGYPKSTQGQAGEQEIDGEEDEEQHFGGTQRPYGHKRGQEQVCDEGDPSLMRIERLGGIGAEHAVRRRPSERHSKPEQPVSDECRAAERVVLPQIDQAGDKLGAPSEQDGPSHKGCRPVGKAELLGASDKRDDCESEQP